MKHSVPTMIGGGILAAWMPLWRFISTLSTFDFMQTSAGRPSIGTFFLPPGLAHSITVLGIAVMVGAFIVLARRSQQRDTKPYSSPTLTAINPATRSTIQALSWFQLLAIRYLCDARHVSGPQFVDRLRDLGFPMMDSDMNKQEFGAVYDRINPMLLTRDQRGIFSLRHEDEVRAVITEIPFAPNDSWNGVRLVSGE